MMMSRQMTSSKLVNPIQTGGGLVLEPSSRRKMNNFKTVQVMTTTLSSNMPGNIFKSHRDVLARFRRGSHWITPLKKAVIKKYESTHGGPSARFHFSFSPGYLRHKRGLCGGKRSETCTSKLTLITMATEF